MRQIDENGPMPVEFGDVLLLSQKGMAFDTFFSVFLGISKRVLYETMQTVRNVVKTNKRRKIICLFNEIKHNSGGQ